MNVSCLNLRGACPAFTLLELMVSSALISIVMVVLLTATSASLGMWRGAEQRISVDREARNGISLIADDLANILPVSDASPLRPVFRKEGNDFVMAFPVLRPTDYQNPDADNVGDVCYVHYRYINSEKKIYRSQIDSKATFDAIALGSPPAPSDYEMLADNVTFLEYNTYDVNGRESADVHTVSLGIGVVDKQERENLERDPPVVTPPSKTTERFFSIHAVVARSP